LQTRSAAPVWLAFTPGVFVFLWATGFIGARLTAGEAEPFSFLFVRCVLVASILAVAALLAGAPWPARRAAGHALVVGALIHGAYLGLVFWSITHGLPAGVAALIVGLQPLLTALLAAPVLGERITARHWLGLGVGILGIALVVLPKLTFAAQGITPATVAGAAVATLSIAIGSIYQKTHVTGLDLRSGNAVQFVGAAMLVGAVALASERLEINWTGEVVFAMAWLVLVLSIGATSLLYLMIRHGEVSRIAGLFYLVPAVTAGLAWVLFGETLAPVQILGLAVCTGAVMLVTRRA